MEFTSLFAVQLRGVTSWGKFDFEDDEVSIKCIQQRGQKDEGYNVRRKISFLYTNE